MCDSAMNSSSDDEDDKCPRSKAVAKWEEKPVAMLEVNKGSSGVSSDFKDDLMDSWSSCKRGAYCAFGNENAKPSSTPIPVSIAAEIAMSSFYSNMQEKISQIDFTKALNTATYIPHYLPTDFLESEYKGRVLPTQAKKSIIKHAKPYSYSYSKSCDAARTSSAYCPSHRIYCIPHSRKKKCVSFMPTVAEESEKLGSMADTENLLPAVNVSKMPHAKEAKKDVEVESGQTEEFLAMFKKLRF